MATSNAKKSSSSGRTRASSNRSTPKGTGSRSRTTASAPRRSSGGQGHKKTGGQSYLTRDILLLFLIAFAVLLFLSLFGLIGAVGRVLASFEFGLFGRLAYVFPFIFFFQLRYLVQNSLSSVICLCCLSGFMPKSRAKNRKRICLLKIKQIYIIFYR